MASGGQVAANHLNAKSSGTRAETIIDVVDDPANYSA
jgi:hypothetical protein